MASTASSHSIPKRRTAIRSCRTSCLASWGSILFINFEPQTIVQSWLNAANATDIGTAAAMGPMTNVDVGVTLGVCNYGDYYWGRGPVGPPSPGA